MQNVTIRSIIGCNLSADQWGLYTSMDEIERVAQVLNSVISNIVNSSESAGEATNKYLDAVQGLGRYGATDSESITVAQRIIALAFQHQHTDV